MYRQDSFFDLSPLGQLGLAGLSLALFVAVVLASRAGLRNRPIWARLAGGLILFWLFVWLSPQVYYMYYRLIIPDLPLQWVIKAPIGVGRLFELLTFQYRSNLSAHSQGVLGWSVLVAPFLPIRRAVER